MGTVWSSLLLVIIGCLCQMARTMHIKHSFRDVNHLAFRQMQVDKNSGNVFIGADNKLLKLSPSLTKLESTFTGPREDNPKCPPPSIPCDKEKYRMVSFSKGIAIDYNNNIVITCSSLFHGFCEKRLLSNITAAQRYIFTPMVPNDQNSSSIVFIAPGPSSSSTSSPTPALFIAATYSNRGMAAYRDLVPAVSAKDTQTFEYSYRDSKGGSYKRIDQSRRQDFLVKYVYGFAFSDFVYFITVQRQGVNSPNYVTKIVRLCQNDRYFNSYIEMPIECRNSSMFYNMAEAAFLDISSVGSVQSANLYVTFHKSNDTRESVVDITSAVCVYDMLEIQSKFDNTITGCYKGIGKLGPEHIHPAEQCQFSSDPPDFCGKTKASQKYSSIDVPDPLEAVPIVEETGAGLTSITTTSVNDRPVLFVGRANGELRKITLAEDGNYTSVEEIRIDYGKPVLKNTYLSADKTLLYAMTKDKVVLLDVADCNLRTTCDTCLAVEDPYCGWCVMSNKCTQKGQCQMSEVTPSWLPGTSGQCAEIIDMVPPDLSVEILETRTDKLSFRVGEISIPNDINLNIKCIFVKGRNTQMTRTMLPGNSQVTCDIPPLSNLPSIDLKSDHTNLDLRLQVGGRSIVSKTISLYDCRIHKTCTLCTSSQFSCQWCPEAHSCMNGASACPGSGVSGAQGSSGVKIADRCPRLVNPKSDIVVHSGEQKEVFAELPNLQPNQTQQLSCRFSYLGKSEELRATYTGGRVYCDRVKFEYDDKETPYVMSSFQVTWGPKAYVLDNPENVQVRIYKCPLMVTNCGKCLTMDPEYDCGWCEGQCRLRKHCPGNWLDRDATCPDPQILRFNPTTGPVGGKTNVSVTGINLGKTVADIQGGVKVAGVKCVVEQSNYEASSGFTCETVPTPFDSSGTISVLVSGTFSAESDSMFKYVDAVPKMLEPKRGPVSGGTTVTVTGTHMNTGSSVSVTVNRKPCTVLRSNATVLEFVTPSHHQEGRMNVTLNFGGAEKILKNAFHYVPDPAIEKIEPKTTILSGGTTLAIQGTNLDIIDQPEFFIRLHDGKRKMVSCHKKNEFLIHCIAPGVKEQNYNVSTSTPEELHYGFVMDSVKSLERISEVYQFGPLLYYPDPEVHMFPEENGVRNFIKDQMLTVEGKFVNIDELISDVMILVGSDVCIRPSGTETSLSCEPPTSPGGLDGEGKAPVQVTIGKFKAKVGYLKYYDVKDNEKPIALGIILGVVLPILTIITLLSICVIRRHLKHGPSDTENYLPDVLRDEDEKKEEEIALSLVNGDIANDKETQAFINDIISGLEDEHLQQNAKQMLLPRSKLELGELVGKGHYGSVYKAELRRADDEQPVLVAVKCLQAKHKDTKSMQNFMREALVVKDFTHPHVLSVLGVSISPNESPLVVVPLLAKGDLRTFVKDTSKNLTGMELLQFAEQIADGMNYLSGLRFVHRNLATRNCLLNENLKVELTDYGLTKDLFDKNHVSNAGNSTKLLLKWMAPETLKTQEFSLKTDVWSFGIVLWELMTRGITPYPDVEPDDLASYLDDDHRMKKPKHCPEFVYKMMMNCWLKLPDERPTFSTLHQDLNKWIQPSEGEADARNKDSETKPLYKNVDCAGSAEYLDVIG